jgi:hypothetical protein
MRFLQAMLALALLSGCVDDNGPPDYMDPPDDERIGPAECDAEFGELKQGLRAVSADGVVNAELMTADKLPLGWFHNDWVIRFTDKATGEPLDELEFGLVQPWMPAHGHNGDNQFPEIAKEEKPGEWSFADINITMAGGWEIQIPIVDSPAGSDDLKFYVCNSQPEPADAGL